MLFNSLSRGRSVRCMGIWCPMAVIEQESIVSQVRAESTSPRQFCCISSHHFQPRGSLEAALQLQLQPGKQDSSWCFYLLCFVSTLVSVLWFALGFGSEPKMVSHAALEMLFEDHPSPLPFPGLKLLFRGKGVWGSYSEAGQAACSLLTFVLYGHMSAMKSYYSCVHLRVMLGTGNHRWSCIEQCCEI